MIQIKQNTPTWPEESRHAEDSANFKLSQEAARQVFLNACPMTIGAVFVETLIIIDLGDASSRICIPHQDHGSSRAAKRFQTLMAVCPYFFSK